jgi:hypothetical protein
MHIPMSDSGGISCQAMSVLHDITIGLAQALLHSSAVQGATVPAVQCANPSGPLHPVSGKAAVVMSPALKQHYKHTAQGLFDSIPGWRQRRRQRRRQRLCVGWRWAVDDAQGTGIVNGRQQHAAMLGEVVQVCLQAQTRFWMHR